MLYAQQSGKKENGGSPEEKEKENEKESWQ